MNEKIIYGGQYKLKYTETDWGHIYYIAKKIKDGWGKWERKTGSTTAGGIKDKSTPLKFWVAKVMARFLNEILSERNITEYDIAKAKKLHTEKLSTAGATGSKIHDWIEKYTRGEKPEMPEEENVLLGVNGFLEWVKQYKVKFQDSELFLYSRKHDYCGTADAIAMIGGKRVLVDYKTSTGLYNDVMLQTASYSKGYEEMIGNKIHGRWVIRLEKRTEEEFQADMDEKGKPNEKYVPFEAVYLDDNKEQMDKDFKAFLHFWEGFKWNRETENFFKLT